MALFQYAFNLPGIRHEKENKASDDAVFIHRSGSLAAVACADGASCCAFGGATAKAVARALAIRLAKDGDRLMHLSDEEIIEETLRLIRCCQRQLAARYSTTLDELGCTFSACVLFPDGGYLALNLGDACVIGRKAGTQETEMLLAPVGDACARATYLTCDWNCGQHICIGRGDGVDAVFVGTDGLEIFWENSISPLLDMCLSDFPKAPQETSYITECISLYTVDDAAGGFLIHAPVSTQLLTGKGPFRYAPQRRRRARQMLHYLSLRESGLSTEAAARGSGWDERSLRKNLPRLRTLGLEWSA